MCKVLKNVIPVLVLAWACLPCFSNNVRLNGTVKVTDVTSAGLATLELDLEWDNSWRDNFNWDAVWIFLKYKPASGAWAPVYLQETGNEASPGYQVMNGKNNDGKVVGVYVFLDGNDTKQHASTKVTLKWQCGYTKASFDENQVFLLAQGIEMVYIPYGAYYLGDNYSSDCLTSNQELVTQGSYSSSSSHGGNPAQNALPGYSGYWCSVGQGNEEWWQIKFSRPYTITSFALGVYAQVQYGYLEGSHTGLNGDWVTLWSGGSNCFPVTSSYPFSNYLTVSSPGAYTYYRIRMKSGDYSGIYNISLKSQESPVVIDSEDALALGIKGYNNSISSLSASYPKGYAGFYVMKYETSQEQYVTFLNTLTKAQQEELLGASFLSALSPGRYIFGDTVRPSYRNGIVLSAKPEGKPYVFDNNLKANTVYGEDGDGQCVACNYMSVNDAMAYASWAGLRPMSELEYERACRAPFPQTPKTGEYAWNDNVGVSQVTGLNAPGEETEVANNMSCNVNSGNGLTGNNQGPVRCGLFARSASTQLTAGATFWGVMEMAGNVQEIVGNVTHASLLRTYNGLGHYDLTRWGTVPPGQFGVRGGSFAGADSLLRTSDRSKIYSYFSFLTSRDSTVGFRLTRTLDDGTVSVNPGTISLSGPLCPGAESTVSETAAASVAGNLPITYIWSYSTDNGSTWTVIPDATGNELTYSAFITGTIYLFRRTAVCALGQASTPATTGIAASALTEILIEPSDTVKNAPCRLLIGVVATGSSLTYQWKKDGVDISGAISSTYTKDSTVLSDIGRYVCKVTGACGTVYSKDVLVIPENYEDGILRDDRNGRTYKTRKMPDGHWWMIEDLKFGNCDASTFDANYQASVQNQIATGYYGVCKHSPESGAGYLYNWQGAMNAAGAYYNNRDANTNNPSGNTSDTTMRQWQGICPSGWHLPSGGPKGEFQKLYDAFVSKYGTYSVTTCFYSDCSDFRGALGGSTGYRGSVNGAGSQGYYWSSTWSNNYSSYWLSFASTNGVWMIASNNCNGMAVRCVKNY